MFEIIKFQFSGRYGIRNKLTGVILTKKNNIYPVQFRTLRGTARYINKITRKLNKTINQLSM